MVTALITGIGGTNSIAILKALNASNIRHHSIGTDIKPLNAGSLLADASYLIPSVHETTAYFNALADIIKDDHIDIIFATTEVEIAFLSERKQELESIYKVVVMVPDKHVLDICQDKYETQRFLEENSFTFIPTIRMDDATAVQQFVEKHAYPLICKPVRGYGSRGIIVVRDEPTLSTVGHSDEYVLQKYIEADEAAEFNEYTAEIFVNKDGSQAGGIIIQRTLVNGESNSGKVVRDAKTIDYLKQVASKLGIKGPCNFQYRMQAGKPYIFEINARYSGTSAVRAHFGFNNVELAIKSFVMNEHMAIPDEAIKEGYFIRYWEEAYATVDAIEGFRSEGTLGV